MPRFSFILALLYLSAHIPSIVAPATPAAAGTSTVAPPADTAGTGAKRTREELSPSPSSNSEKDGDQPGGSGNQKATLVVGSRRRAKKAAIQVDKDGSADDTVTQSTAGKKRQPKLSEAEKTLLQSAYDATPRSWDRIMEKMQDAGYTRSRRDYQFALSKRGGMKSRGSVSESQKREMELLKRFHDEMNDDWKRISETLAEEGFVRSEDSCRRLHAQHAHGPIPKPQNANSTFWPEEEKAYLQSAYFDTPGDWTQITAKMEKEGYSRTKEAFMRQWEWMVKESSALQAQRTDAHGQRTWPLRSEEDGPEGSVAGSQMGAAGEMHQRSDASTMVAGGEARSDAHQRMPAPDAEQEVLAFMTGSANSRHQATWSEEEERLLIESFLWKDFKWSDTPNLFPGRDERECRATFWSLYSQKHPLLAELGGDALRKRLDARWNPAVEARMVELVLKHPELRNNELGTINWHAISCPF